MYFIGDDDAESDIFRGNAYNKQKQKANEELLPLRSPFIPIQDGDATEDSGSGTDRS